MDLKEAGEIAKRYNDYISDDMPDGVSPPQPSQMGDALLAVIPEVERLRAILERHAVIRHVRLASGGGEVPSGFSCEICDAECGGELSELRHMSTCPLFPINRRQE